MRFLLILLLTSSAIAEHIGDVSRGARPTAPAESSLLSLQSACAPTRGIVSRPVPKPVPVQKAQPKPEKENLVGLTESLGIPDLVCDSPNTGFHVEYQRGTPENPKSRITVSRNGIKEAEYACVEGDPECATEFTEYWTDFMSSVFDFAKEPSRPGLRMPPGISCRPR